MSKGEGVKERDTSSLHSSLGLDDKQDILRGHDEDDGKGRRMRRGCQLSGRQKICFLVCVLILVLVALGAGIAIASAPAILRRKSTLFIYIFYDPEWFVIVGDRVVVNLAGTNHSSCTTFVALHFRNSISHYPRFCFCCTLVALTDSLKLNKLYRE